MGVRELILGQSSHQRQPATAYADANNAFSFPVHSVSAEYDPKFDDPEVERIQGDLTYDFDWSAGPGGAITNQDPAAPSTSNSSSCDVGFSTVSAAVDDKTVSATCTVTGTFECIGPDGIWDTEDDDEGLTLRASGDSSDAFVIPATTLRVRSGSATGVVKSRRRRRGGSETG